MQYKKAIITAAVLLSALSIGTPYTDSPNTDGQPMAITSACCGIDVSISAAYKLSQDIFTLQ